MNIVFVHIGDSLPPHLVLNLKRTIQLFPEQTTYLITQKDCKIPEIEQLKHFHILDDDRLRLIENTLLHPKDFRRNFWFNTLNRFLALDQFMAVHGEEVLHVESDVILSSDFPFGKFSQLQRGIAFPKVNKYQGIASTLYLRDKDASSLVTKVLLSEVESDPHTTDMLILNKLYLRYQDDVQLLPTGPSEADFYLPHLEKDILREMEISRNIIHGVIDGLDIGYFLFGEDPRNHRGVRILRKSIPDYYLDVRKLKLEFSGIRNFVDIDIEGTKLPIYSLHIHSKNLRLFDLRRAPDDMRRAVMNSRMRMQSEFVLKIFFQTAIKAIFRRFEKFVGRNSE